MEKKENNKYSTRRLANLCIVSAVAVLAVIFAYNMGILSGFAETVKSGGGMMLPIVIIAAIVDSINPCAFSVLILTIGFLMSLNKDRSNILRAGSAYIFGIYLVYILIGLGLLQTMQFFGVPHFMAKLGAIALIILGGLNIINDLFPSFPIKIKIPQMAHRPIAVLMEKGSIPAFFSLGMTVGLYEFPCTGGPYLMILGLLHDKGTYLSGFLYLFFYNFIFVFPLILILMISSDKAVLDKVQGWKSAESGNMRLYGGIATVVLGAIMLFM